MTDESEPIIVTLQKEIITEEGAFETFKAKDHTERSDCIACHGTSISDGTIRVQKNNLSSVVYL